jgi:hypothetical protein
MASTHKKTVVSDREPTPIRQRPHNPLPAQHQEWPGIEKKIHPRPQYDAPYYRGSQKLEGKTVLVTGRDSGIGRAVAVLAAREGANVAIIYLPEEQQDAEETAAAIKKESRQALLISGDVTDPEFCISAVDETLRKFGQLDVLVNNAGYQQHQESGLEHRTIRSHLQDEYLWLFLYGESGPPSFAKRFSDREHRI